VPDDIECEASVRVVELPSLVRRESQAGGAATDDGGK
jgi:hypothetical protein